MRVLSPTALFNHITLCKYVVCCSHSLGTPHSLSPPLVYPALDPTSTPPSFYHRTQEAQQEAYFNVGPFGGDFPSPMANRWYPDLGQNMQGT
jgi:hypothetical protein